MSESRQSWRRIFSGAGYLITLQAVNYALPILTIPYLMRTLGMVTFGKLMFARAICQYMSMFVDYGFNLSATREIAQAKAKGEDFSQIVSTVLFVRLASLISTFLLLAGTVAVVPGLKADATIYLVSFGIVAGQGLFPTWYYQGTERMREMTLLNSIPKVVFSLLVFVLVQKESHASVAAWLHSLGFIVPGFLAFASLATECKIRRLPAPADVVNRIRHGFSPFLSIASSTILAASPSFLLGVFGLFSELAVYSAAEKIVSVAKSFLGAASQAVYPVLSSIYTQDRHKYRRMWRSVAMAALGAGLIMCLGILIAGKPLLSLICGPDGVDSFPILAALSLGIVLNAAILASGMQGLLVIGEYGTLARSQILPSALFLLTSPVALWMYGLLGLVLSLLFAEVAVIAFRLRALWARGFFHPIAGNN